VRVYQYASDERLGAALIPAALILALGLVASLALVPGLERRSRLPAPGGRGPSHPTRSRSEAGPSGGQRN
jgi:hypothetical protein